MTVVATKTVKACTVCASPKRTEIDLLLEIRSKRGSLPNGQRVNGEYLYALLREWEVFGEQQDMSIEASLKNHWRKHVEVITEAGEKKKEVAADEAEAMALLARDPESMNVEAYLHRIIQIDAAETEARIARGEKSGVTKDHALKAAQELSRRGANQATGELMKTLGGALAEAFRPKDTPALPAPAPELPSGTPTVIDVEYHDAELAFGDDA